MKNKMKAGAGDAFMAETIATIDSQIDTEIFSNVLAVEYGVTDRLSVGLILPIVHGETIFKGLVENSSSYAEQTNTLPQVHPEKAIRQNLASSLSIATFNKVLKEQYGYSGALQSWSGTGLGDLELGAKYQYFKNSQWRATAKTGFRLPTGREDDPDQLLDLAFGDGQTDFAFFSLIDFDLHPQLTFTWEAGYTVQFPHDVNVRVPLSADLPLGAQKTKVNHSPGDFLESAFEMNVSPLSRVTLSPRYRFKQKLKDDYGGTAAAALEANSSQILHEGQMQIEYSNLKAVRAGAEKIPFSVAAFYKLNFAGKNATDFRTAGLQLKTYF